MTIIKYFCESQVSPGDLLIDIGCGNKGNTKNLSNAVVSVDAWPDVHPDLLLDLELYSLPYGTNTFDVAFMIDFIEHLSKSAGKRLLEEVKQIVRKKIVLFTPVIWSDNAENVNNKNLWCYGNTYDYHKSLWTREDFKDGWTETVFPNYYLGVWNK